MGIAVSLAWPSAHSTQNINSSKPTTRIQEAPVRPAFPLAMRTALQGLQRKTSLPLYAPIQGWPHYPHFTDIVVGKVNAAGVGTANYQLWIDSESAPKTPGGRGGSPLAIFQFAQWPSVVSASAHLLPHPLVPLAPESGSKIPITINSHQQGYTQPWVGGTDIVWREQAWIVIIRGQQISGRRLQHWARTVWTQSQPLVTARKSAEHGLLVISVGSIPGQPDVLNSRAQIAWQQHQQDFFTTCIAGSWSDTLAIAESVQRDNQSR